MKKILGYLILLVSYMLFGMIGFAVFSTTKNVKVLIVLILLLLCLFFITVILLENKKYLFNMARKIKTCFNYFDYENIKESISHKEKIDEYEAMNKKVSILTIHICNDKILCNMTSAKRENIFKNLMRIINLAIKEYNGEIYNICNDTITCAFYNDEYDVNSFNAIKAALLLDVHLIHLKELDKMFDSINFNMSINEQIFDVIKSDNVLWLYGDMSYADSIRNIDLTDSIVINEKIYLRYKRNLDVEYIGTYYVNREDTKLYRINNVKEEVNAQNLTYEKSKLVIKKKKSLVD